MQDTASMTPATRAVFDALIGLGQGNVHELAERSGKARSTTDKAIKALADADLIVAVDTDADAAEGTPTRWTLAEGVAAQIEDALSTDADADVDVDVDVSDPAGEDDSDGPDTAAAEHDHSDADSDSIVLSDDEPDDADADAGSDRADGDDRDHDGDADAGVDTNADDDSADGSDENADVDAGGLMMVVAASRPGDRKVMTIKAVLAEHGDDGASLGQIVSESGIGEATASRLLTAMEQADAARRLPGIPARWIAGPTKASEVDPNPTPPRCPLCLQVIRGLSESPEAVAQVQSLIRPDGTLHVVLPDGTIHPVTLPTRPPARVTGFAPGGVRRADVTVNADGSQPFAKGELERLTFDTLKANPGRTMTPQEIATAISAQLGGRAVSSGAVRNNCGKLGAAGRIVMVSESPWAFQYPAAAADVDQAGDAAGEQS